jgi:hypothetical protein
VAGQRRRGAVVASTVFEDAERWLRVSMASLGTS